MTGHPIKPLAPVAHAQFPKLFSPITLRKVTLRNRIVMLPMGSRFARDGEAREGDVAFYRARARGGVGAIITGGTPVHASGTMRNRGYYEPFVKEALPSLARLADAVHSEGAAIFGQLFHRGREFAGDTDWASWAPSAVASPNDPQTPHEMSLSEIEEIIEGFGTSAANLCKCGFDGIEIHGAHGYLVAQFLSAQANRREDRYGGSPQNRMRFLLEIVDSIRSNIGPDAVLGMRMSADEGEDVVDGIRLAYSEQIAKALAATGKVDYLSVTMGIRGAYVKDMSVHVGAAVPLAAAIRKASALPVIAGQRINHPPLAEKVLASGAADMIGMARALIADWEWVAKARDGRVEEIRPCIACNQVCRSGIMGCVHSPTAGRETMWGPGSLKPAAVRRKVVVVGGGPAGMEAAIQSAERGHAVVLFEAGRRLGGQARIAALAPNRTEVDGVVAYRALELARLGVQLRLGVRADVAAVLAEKPDAVVIATGAVPALPEVEGGELSHVIDVIRALEPDAQTEKRLAAASSAVVVDNGSGFWETCGTAEALGKRGLQVHLVTPAGTVAGSVPVEAAAPLMRRLRWLGVTLLPLHRVSSIEAGKISVYDVVRVAATRILEERELPADIVVYYAGKRAVTELAVQLEGRVPELHMVGDCVSPRRINHAVLEGHRAGRSL
jgi:2,4-dienoyl-CoA reductase (NADPH2)